MTGVPVETVVELLLQNAFCGQVVAHGERFFAVDGNVDELRTKVREYVETLVRKDGE